MGSYDITCMVSDIGISCGDPIFAMLLEGGNPISPLIPGHYADYGVMEVEREPKAFLKFLRGELQATPAGSNSFHEPEVVPSKITSWEILNGLVRQGRVCLKGHSWRGNTLSYAGLTEALQANGIDVGPGMGKGQVYIHTLQSDIHAIDLPWNTLASDPLVERIRQIALGAGYGIMVVPAAGRGYVEGCTDFAVGLIAAPVPSSKSFHWKLHQPSERYVSIGYIRRDVAEALWPTDRASLAQFQQVLSKLQGEKELAKHMLLYELHEQGFYFGLGSSYGESYLGKQLALAKPASSELWLLQMHICQALNGNLRRGIRPHVNCVGSQCASEDVLEQRRYHETLVKVLQNIDAANSEE